MGPPTFPARPPGQPQSRAHLACSCRVRCFPDTRKECRNSASVSSRTCSETGRAFRLAPPPARHAGVEGEGLCPRGHANAGDRDGSWLVPPWFLGAKLRLLLAPGGLAAAQSAQWEVGVTVPDKGLTRNGNWVTNWARGHSFCKSRPRA